MGFLVDGKTSPSASLLEAYVSVFRDQASPLVTGVPGSLQRSVPSVAAGCEIMEAALQAGRACVVKL